MKEKGVEPEAEAVPAAMVMLPPMLLAALLLLFPAYRLSEPAGNMCLCSLGPGVPSLGIETTTFTLPSRSTGDLLICMIYDEDLAAPYTFHATTGNHPT